MRFGEKGKLSAKYVGAYEILEQIGKVAYRLALPMEFEKMHDVCSTFPNSSNISLMSVMF